MAMTDPIADMLTRLRNANSVLHDKVEIPGSKMKRAIANLVFVLTLRKTNYLAYLVVLVLLSSLLLKVL